MVSERLVFVCSGLMNRSALCRGLRILRRLLLDLPRGIGRHLNPDERLATYLAESIEKGDRIGVQGLFMLRPLWGELTLRQWIIFFCAGNH